MELSVRAMALVTGERPLNRSYGLGKGTATAKVGVVVMVLENNPFFLSPPSHAL